MKTITTISRTSSFIIAAIAFAGFATAGETADPLAKKYAAIDKEAVLKVDAEDIWRANCASCHGRDGKGETRVGRRAGVKSFVDNDYQKSFSNELAFHYTKTGLTRDGKELMKPFGKGLAEDEGLTDPQIKALVEYLRKFDPKWTQEMNATSRAAELKKEQEKKTAD